MARKSTLQLILEFFFIIQKMGNICAKNNYMEPSRNHNKRPNKINTLFSTTKNIKPIFRLNGSIKSKNFSHLPHRTHHLWNHFNIVISI
jgi:hypothetical protein